MSSVYKVYNETACNDASLVNVLQEIYGYAISVRTNAEACFFFYGTGSNGKSLCMRLLQALVGPENCSAISLSALNANFGISDLIGKKLNLAAESEDLPNSEKLKALVSADTINIQRKYKEDWVGRLFAKHILCVNNLPATTDVSPGFFRKIIIVPFDNHVTPEKMDRDLPEKLMQELPGILNWAYIGYQRLRENNFHFSKCEAIDRIKTKYIERENPTETFFQSVYIKTNKQRDHILKSSIYDRFVKWCEETGHKTMTRPSFFNALKTKSSDPASEIELNFVKINGSIYLTGYVEKEPNILEIELYA